MLLPTPTAEEITRFQKIHLEQYGSELNETDARTELTRLVQFLYLTGGHDAYRQRKGLNFAYILTCSDKLAKFAPSTNRR